MGKGDEEEMMKDDEVGERGGGEEEEYRRRGIESRVRGSRVEKKLSREEEGGSWEDE